MQEIIKIRLSYLLGILVLGIILLIYNELKETPTQINPQVFYNDIDTIQTKVLFKFANDIKDSEINETITSKYVGLINERFIDKQTGEINKKEKPTEILNIAGKEIKVYALLGKAGQELELNSFTEKQIQDFAIDEKGNVYFYKGIILDPNNKKVANVTKDLTITATKKSIKIEDY